MSSGSEKVKSWRRRFRERVRMALGNQCSVCGYDRCAGALDVHHTDPSVKNYSFGEIRGHPRAAASLVAELRQCTMLCKNCHIEAHTGVIPFPDKSTFDEALFLESIKPPAPKEKPKNSCGHCGNECDRKYCSVTCAGAAKDHGKWKLPDWNNKSVQDIAVEFGIKRSLAYNWREKYRESIKPLSTTG